jgi:MOSC domain-containing protein YiiM
MVRKFDIDGDAQADLAGHGGEQRAVFVYQMTTSNSGPVTNDDQGQMS